MTDNRFKVLCAIPVVLFILSFVVVDFMPYRSALTADEMQVINFVPEDLSLPNLKRSRPSGGFVQPITLSPAQEPTAETKPSEFSTEARRMKVTMIVRGSAGAMAVVDGALVREGDTVGSLTVKKIEANRVLVQPDSRSGGPSPEALQQWLVLEDMP